MAGRRQKASKVISPGGVEGQRTNLRRAPHSRNPTDETAEQTTGGPPNAADSASNGADNRPPPGLDQARHEAAQRAAHGADMLRHSVFPALMGAALSLDHSVETSAFPVYLDQVLKEAGNPTDPIERMLIEQTCLAHFRIAQLHVGAGLAKGVEAVKMYTSVAARLLGEMRRTALALRAYRGRVPEDRSEARVKLFKMAQ